MSLKAQGSSHFVMTGPITFDNAAKVVADGQKLLAQSPSVTGDRNLTIDLIHMEQADSSALSVFLSWIRLAQQQGQTLYFANIPVQLEALAQVSDIHDLIQKP